MLSHWSNFADMNRQLQVFLYQSNHIHEQIISYLQYKKSQAMLRTINLFIDPYVYSIP